MKQEKRRRLRFLVKDYEVVNYTMRRPDGTRFIDQKILEKGSCRIIGERRIELAEKEAS